MDPFRPRTWEVEIVDPIDDEKWTVTLRGESAADELNVSRTADEEGPSQAGYTRVVNAIVGWSLPVEFTPDTLAQLRQELFGQIVKAVNDGPPTPPAAPATGRETSIVRVEPVADAAA